MDQLVDVELGNYFDYYFDFEKPKYNHCCKYYRNCPIINWRLISFYQILLFIFLLCVILIYWFKIIGN